MTQKEYLEKFRKVLETMASITEKKNSDYAGPSDAFSNFNLIEKLTDGKVSCPLGIFTRMVDKMSRIGSLLAGRERKVVDESVVDSAIDLAVYSVILVVCITNPATMRQETPTQTQSTHHTLYERRGLNE